MDFLFTVTMEPNHKVENLMHLLVKTPRMEKDFPKMIPKHCEVCQATTGLLRCSACGIYYYCGREHQKAGRAAHRRSCDSIKKFKENVADREALLRIETPNTFDADRGRFCVSLSNRKYLEARSFYSEMQVRSLRRQGIEDAADNLLGIMDLDRTDSQGVRFVVPFVLLRLYRDQQCYDFCKFWQKTDCRDRTVSLDLSVPFKGLDVPFLDIDGADATEPPDLWTSGQFTRLANISAIYLIKFRLRYGLNVAKKFMAENPGLSPQDVLAQIRIKYCGDSLERKPELIADSDAVTSAIEKLDEQLSSLFVAVHKINGQFWKLMVRPTIDALICWPNLHSPGDLTEAEQVFMNSYSAWVESPGAIQSIRDAGGSLGGRRAA